MTVSIPSYIRALIDRLETDATLAALVTGGADVAVADATKVRLYGGNLPARAVMSLTVPNAIAPALVFQTAGGGADRYIEALFTPRVEVRAYGPSEAENEGLWLAALAATRRMTRNGTTLWLEANLNVALPISRREPNGGFRYHTGFVTFTAIAH